MRIDGTDATTLSTVDFKRPETSLKDIQAKPREKFDPLDTKSISQLTEFDKKEIPISEKIVIDAIEKANKAISGASRRFEFSIHEKTKAIMIKVLDSDTNQVIREIPPEKILDMVAKMWEMAGLIVDERR